MAIFRVKSTRLREQYGQMARAKRHHFPDMGSSLLLTLSNTVLLFTCML